jgi:hypothetical protein
MTQRFGNLLHGASGWGLLAAMVIAPWLLGTSPPQALQNILWLLVAISACWAAALALLRRVPAMNYASLIAKKSRRPACGNTARTFGQSPQPVPSALVQKINTGHDVDATSETVKDQTPE